MRRTLLALLFTLALATDAIAAEGVNLRWNACLGDGGTLNRNFACDTNTGSEQLFVSFEVDSSIADISGMDCNLWLATPVGAPGPWWQFKNVGACRRDALTLAAANPAPGGACMDWAPGVVGATVAVITNYGGGASTLTRLMFTMGSPAPVTLEPGHEYFAMRLTISHAKTVGTGACGGCSAPACLGVEGIYLNGSGGSRHDVATETRYQSSVASWQESSPSSYFVHTTGMYPYQNRDLRMLECAAAVPARNRTWGTLKSLYY